jgi:hypothetical protein
LKKNGFGNKKKQEREAKRHQQKERPTKKSSRQRKKEAKLLEKRRQQQQEKNKIDRRDRIARAIEDRAELAALASPSPSLDSDGRLDAGPNQLYDRPTVDDDLSTLPTRQRALIRTILSDLPRNAPRHLTTALDNYDGELRDRGVQPILGLLKDMFAVVESAVGAPDTASEWLPDGLRTAFERFCENHELFLRHFPLDPKREEIYARTPIDESNAAGRTLYGPFMDVANAVIEANRARLTTDEFVKIVDKMADFAKIISTLPPTSAPRSGTVERTARERAAFVVGPDDQINSSPPVVDAKKRMLLSGFGFFERVYHLLSSSAQLLSPPEGNALLTALRNAIAALSKLIGW